MTSACDPLGSFARGLADSGAASLMSVSRGTEEIASAMADYMRSSFRAGGEFARAFLAAASVKDAVAILGALVPVVIAVMLEHPDADFGEVLYPVV